MNYDFSKLKKSATGAEDWIKKEFATIRTGQATPTVLDGVRVESYGAQVPISQIASIATEGARTLRIAPWDSTHSKEIEKAITLANLGLSVAIDDKGLRVNFPELTSERRAQIVKIAKEKLEEAKKQIRAHRDETMKDLKGKEKAGGYTKDDIFRFEKDAQKIVDEANKKLEEAFAKKEKEILS
ncbi:MAG: ribosome recycling factor [Patescibacteria group bacterium]|nr:ribosome recycling factor [Patescibacteria group bacterium]